MAHRETMAIQTMGRPSRSSHYGLDAARLMCFLMPYLEQDAMERGWMFGTFRLLVPVAHLTQAPRF